MSINALIQTSRLTLNVAVEHFRSQRYFVDNSFQRRLVWTERQKVRLIETILTGFPMPEIYLWQQPADPETGQQRHSIVDGQQRVTTIVQFVSNEWSLKPAYLNEENRLAPFAGRYWRDLMPETKQIVWDYVVNARTIPNEILDTTVRAMFTRLNETDRSLNPQEFRNAEFNGEFIKAAETVANDPHWQQWRVFNESQIRRMGDIELASSLLTVLRQGIVGETTESVNEIYDLYNDVYEQRDTDIAAIRSFLDAAETTYFANAQTKDFFTKTIHLYSLFCIHVILARTMTAADIVPRLNAFVQDYQEGSQDELIETYRLGSSSRTRSRAQRNRRVDSLRRWVTGERVPADRETVVAVNAAPPPRLP